MFSVVRRRFSTKRSEPHHSSQEALPAPVLGDESHGAKRQVYLVTFPHPRPGNALVAITLFSRQGIIETILRACATPSSSAPGVQAQPVTIDKAAAFLELHKADGDGVAHGHYHVAVKGGSCFRFAPVKKALHDVFHLASHWSCTHVGYWSPVRYCAVPNPVKPRATLDPQPVLWSRVGTHPPLHLVYHEPQIATAMRAKRQRMEDTAAEKGKSEPRMTDYQLWPIVVESGIRNTVAHKGAHLRFLQYVKAHCSAAVCEYTFRNRARLSALIDDIWRWESIDDVVAVASKTPLQSVTDAMNKPCICGGNWSRFVAYGLDSNGVDIKALCKAVLQSLADGRSPTTPIVTLAGLQGGECTSFFLKGLVASIGAEHVFLKPTHPAFPLYGIDTAKIVSLTTSGSWAQLSH